MPFLEVACFGPESAIIASEAGADRIELCEDQAAGGVSPPVEWLQQVKARVSIPVFVMVRPRGGDFCFSHDEFQQMKASLEQFKQHGADGFVLGILDQDRQVDISRTAELVQLAQPLPCTFHRAFDDTCDPVQALDHVRTTGCRAILSSGGAASAVHGIDVLQALIGKAEGKLDIIPGGGVRSKNLAAIHAMTGAKFFHSAAVINGSSLPDALEIRRMKHQLRHPPHPDEISSSLSTSRSNSASDALDDDGLSVSAVSTGHRRF